MAWVLCDAALSTPGVRRSVATWMQVRAVTGGVGKQQPMPGAVLLSHYARSCHIVMRVCLTYKWHGGTSQFSPVGQQLYITCEVHLCVRCSHAPVPL
jgi:hypothetical protein